MRDDLMTTDPLIRASDAEREQVATMLGEHAAAGRLSSDEPSGRLEPAGPRTSAG